jgi:hypothetical protein
VSEFADHTTGYDVVEGEPPELLGRNLNSAAHLGASATAFFFLAFLFADLYLRSLNSAGLWQPKNVKPSFTFGTIVMVLTIASAVVVRWGYADQCAERRREWRLKGVIAFAIGLAAVVLQVVEWTVIGFGPADGGYASVFMAWTAFNALFVLGVLFWLETVLATAFRYRDHVGDSPPAGHASGDPYRTNHDVNDPLTLVRPELSSLSFYYGYLAGLGVVLWVVLYVF